MPIFEYVCNSCGKKFELLVRSSSTPLVCPECSGRDLKRLMSSFAFSSKDSAGHTVPSSGCSGCSGGDCSHCSG